MGLWSLARFELMQPRRPKHRSHIEEFPGKEAMPATFAPGRRCRSCHAVLSIYNEGCRCWACCPTGRRIYKYGGNFPSDDVLDFAELMSEEAA